MGQDFKSGDFVKIKKWSSELNLAQYILRGGGILYFEYPQSKLQTSSEQSPAKKEKATQTGLLPVSAFSYT
jgi:hypothetical protein